MTKLIRESKLLARHSSVYAVGNFLQRATSLVLLPLYTSHLTPADYGIREIVVLVTDVLGILLSTAVASALFRFYFEYEDERDRRAVLSSAAIGLGVVGLAALAAMLPAAKPLAGLLLDDLGLGHYFAISFAALWFQVLNKLFFSYLQARQQSLQFVLFSLLRMVGAIALNIWLIVGLGLGVLGILISTLVIGVVIFLTLTVPVLVRIGLRFDWEKLKEMIRFGGPMILSQLGGFVVHLSNRFFLKGYVSLAETGIFSLAARLGTIPSQFISEPFNMTWLPRRFEIAKEEDSEQVFGRIFTWFLALITLAGLGISALAHDLVRLMADPRYWTAAEVVPLIVLANIVFTFHYHFNLGLMLEKKTAWLARINIANAGLVLLLNWLLIPRLGGMGAALATLLCYSFKSGMTYWCSRRFYRLHFEGRRVLKVLVAAAVVYLAVGRIEIATPWLSLLAKAGAVLAGYLVMLVVLRFFTPREWERARGFAAKRLGRRA